MSDAFSCVNSIQHTVLVNVVNDVMSFGNLVKVAVVTRLQLVGSCLRALMLLDCSVVVGLLGVATIAASKLLRKKSYLLSAVLSLLRIF
jgi:hypothetical protein